MVSLGIETAACAYSIYHHTASQAMVCTGLMYYNATSLYDWVTYRSMSRVSGSFEEIDRYGFSGKTECGVCMVSSKNYPHRLYVGGVSGSAIVVRMSGYSATDTWTHMSRNYR